MCKIVSAKEAVGHIQNGVTLGIGGFGAYAAPETLLAALAERYETEQAPKALTVTCGISCGDNTTQAVGMNRIAKEGLIDTILAAHFGNPKCIGEMVAANKVAAYALPLGVIEHLFSAAAGKKPGVLTHVGLRTYADPRLEGCIVNERAKAQGREIVKLIDLDGQEALIYKTFPIDAAIVKATYADEDGNLSAEGEGVSDTAFNLAAAAHNNGGLVIAEVKKIVGRGTLNARNVVVHSSLVDYVVVADESLEAQSYAAKYRPELSGEARVSVSSLPPMDMSVRKVIARRAAEGLTCGAPINLGIGIPSGVGSVCNEKGVEVCLSLESGPIGGVPVEGVGFGANVNPEVIYPIDNVFQLYDGGMLGATFLGAGEIDSRGNVNVSRFGARCTGPGGFINISQNTQKVCFLSTFTAGGLQEEIRDGKLTILQEGETKKFCRQVQQITFSGDYAVQSGQEVLYITERAVFRLLDGELVLTEIAPGVDLQRDILDQMEFAPRIAAELRTMDESIFR